MGLDNPAFHDISYSIEEKESHDGFGGKNPDLIGKPPSADELIKIIHFEPPIDKLRFKIELKFAVANKNAENSSV